MKGNGEPTNGGGDPPKITFGVIVLNGEPFTRYCLRQLYSFAHEIIVVEGACRGAEALADERGHSTDGTVEALERFKAEEDPAGKVRMIRKEGLWSEKDEMSRAYAEAATGDWLWQVDIDEFYRHEDMSRVCEMLAGGRVDAVSFRQLTFWGWFDVICDGVYLRGYNASQYHRLFRWGPGYRYVTHRPPTVADERGVDLRRKRWLSARQTERMGVRLYHLGLLLPKQIREKTAYYSRAHWSRRENMHEWAERNWFRLENPFRVHNIYWMRSWLKPYRGGLPEQVEALRGDIETGRMAIERRPMEDVRRLLERRGYRMKTLWLTWYAGTLVRWIPRGVWRWLRQLRYIHHSRKLRRLLGLTDRSKSDRS